MGQPGDIKLHVLVDLMDFPLGKVIVIGLQDGCLLVAGAFSTRKWPVAPESDMACLTDLVTLAVLKIASAWAISCKLLACISFFHALFLVGMVGIIGRMIFSVGGLCTSSWDDVVVVVSSA